MKYVFVYGKINPSRLDGTDMTNEEMYDLVRTQLAIDYNCNPDDFLKDGIIFSEAKELDGRRALPFGSPRLEMITMGHSLIVNASKELLPILKKRLAGKSNYEALTAPFVYGVNPYYLPDVEQINPIESIVGYDFSFIEGSEIKKYYKFQNLHNALQYDENSKRPESLGMIATSNDKLVGIVVASADCKQLWQIGIDVLPEHRGMGLAKYMVNQLTIELLNRNIIPYYTTDCSNIASQKTAVAAGYKPAWSHCFKHRLHKSPLIWLNYLKY